MKFNNRNVHISPSAKIGRNVRIGDDTVIYDNVEIGDNATVCNNCVIGEPLNEYYTQSEYVNPVTKIGANSLIRSHAIIYAGSDLGENLSCGHRVTIRENSQISDHVSIGTLCDFQGNITIGKYSRFHSNVHIGQGTTIGNFVFVYPFVVFTNDPRPPSSIIDGATIGDFTQIAVHSVILPGISLGKNCLVAANSTVNSNFDDELLIMGTPAKAMGSVRDIKSKTKPGTMHYPWMYNFERGMPWENIGFENWVKHNHEI